MLEDAVFVAEQVEVANEASPVLRTLSRLGQPCINTRLRITFFVNLLFWLSYLYIYIYRERERDREILHYNATCLTLYDCSHLGLRDLPSRDILSLGAWRKGQIRLSSPPLSCS